MSSDEQLMLAFQKGSREAFSELFCRYRQLVYAFFRRRLAVAGRAEELAQETFLAVIRGVARYQPLAPFHAYLWGIARNLLLAERRRPVAAPLPDDADPPGPSADVDTGLWIRQALAALEPEQREILMLREYEQLSYEEIAGLLKMPVNTVRSRLFRARLAMKALLVPHE